MMRHILQTGLRECFDQEGGPVPWGGTLQDGDLQKGLPLPSPRFTTQGEGLVLDHYTGLCWPRDLSGFSLPVRWEEGLSLVADLNRQHYLGHADWRMPNRRELRSLIWHSAKNPALPPDHPFQQIKSTWYWTSTTSAMYPAHAWRVHMEGGRMFWTRKDQFLLFLPVRGGSQVLPRTGQLECYQEGGERTECSGTGQDGELRAGAAWPQPRFRAAEHGVRDLLTGLIWHPSPADLGTRDWEGALQQAAALNETGRLTWRLPNINELESLVDASMHTPALPEGHPFPAVQEVYWSSTTSGYQTDWAFALYMHKGAVGVGHKSHTGFALWPVAEGDM